MSAIPAFGHAGRHGKPDGAKADPDDLAEAKRKKAEMVMGNEDAHVHLDAGAAVNVLPELTYLQAALQTRGGRAMAGPPHQPTGPPSEYQQGRSRRGANGLVGGA